MRSQALWSDFFVPIVGLARVFLIGLVLCGGLDNRVVYAQVADEPPAEVVPAVVADNQDVEPSPRNVEKDGLKDWVYFSSARDAGNRVFASGRRCSFQTCVVTSDGAIYFNLEPNQFDIRLWLLQDRRLTRIDYIQENTLSDYEILERLVDRTPNKRLWSLTRQIEAGNLDTIYIFGLLRQYRFAHGSPMIVEITSKQAPYQSARYFFRLNQAEWKLHIDVALVVPINAWNLPKPEPAYQNASLSGAITFALYKPQDLGKERSFWGKFAANVHPTAFFGPLRRRLETDGKLESEQDDVFLGLGATLYGVLFVGWGMNLFRAPFTTGPFVGFNLIKLAHFMNDINESNPAKWDSYIATERSLDRRFEPESEPEPEPEAEAEPEPEAEMGMEMEPAVSED